MSAEKTSLVRLTYPLFAAIQSTLMKDLIEIYLRVSRGDIALLKFAIESYEGIAIVRTIDRKKATVAVLAMPDLIHHVRATLESLREYMDWYEIPPPEEQDDWLMQRMHEE
jgi:hypothetical protein